MLRGVNKAERFATGATPRKAKSARPQDACDEIKTGPNQEPPKTAAPFRGEEYNEGVAGLPEKETGIPLRFQFHRSLRDN